MISSTKREECEIIEIYHNPKLTNIIHTNVERGKKSKNSQMVEFIESILLR